MTDAHVHVWALDPERYPWHQTLPHVPIPTTPATVEDLLAEMEGAGVEKAVLVQPSVYGWDNSYLCDCLERYRGRFAGVCLVDPHSENAGEDLRFWCTDRGCQGVRINLIAERDGSWVLGTLQERIWDAAEELGASVSLQMLPAHAAVAGELAARRSGVRFIIDYLGGEAFHDGSGGAAIDLLASHPNVFFKLLSLGQDSHGSYPFPDLWPLYERALEAFGADRVVFGTDFPHVRQSCGYDAAIAWLDELPFVDAAARPLLSDRTAHLLWTFPRTTGGSR
jgi:predicted TIM-barrel fold metal-dependent hydrolase